MNTKSLIKNTLIAGVISFSFISCENEKTLSDQEIPTEIKTYVSTHFPNSQITHAEHEKDAMDENYEITLSDNVKLEFDATHEVTDIDSSTQLPDSVISSSISEYVTANYPDNHITDWELDDGNQQVELDNGIDLEFDMNGEFLRIDK